MEAWRCGGVRAAEANTAGNGPGRDVLMLGQVHVDRKEVVGQVGEDLRVDLDQAGRYLQERVCVRV